LNPKAYLQVSDRLKELQNCQMAWWPQAEHQAFDQLRELGDRPSSMLLMVRPVFASRT